MVKLTANKRLKTLQAANKKTNNLKYDGSNQASGERGLKNIIFMLSNF